MACPPFNQRCRGEKACEPTEEGTRVGPEGRYTENSTIPRSVERLTAFARAARCKKSKHAARVETRYASKDDKARKVVYNAGGKINGRQEIER